MQREMAGVIGGNHQVDDSGFDSMESGDIEFSAEEDSMTAGDRGVGGDTMRRPMQPGR